MVARVEDLKKNTEMNKSLIVFQNGHRAAVERGTANIIVEQIKATLRSGEIVKKSTDHRAQMCN